MTHSQAAKAFYLVSYFGKKAILSENKMLIATSLNPIEYKLDHQ